MIVLKTLTGSRLYGFSHANSDYDYYSVDNQRRSGQVIAGDQDNVTINLHDFVNHVEKGVPQAMEALYSPVKVVHPDYRGYFAGMEPDQNKLIRTYRRTIRHFVLEDTNKHRRHALRLTINLSEWWYTGSFDPTIPRDLVPFLTEWAESERDTVAYINEFSPVVIWDKALDD